MMNTLATIHLQIHPFKILMALRMAESKVPIYLHLDSEQTMLLMTLVI